MLLDLPLEIRLQIWSHVLQPTKVYPCGCALKAEQCTSHRLGSCCENISTYEHCDNRILRLNRQVHDEVLPLIRQVEHARVFVLCNNLCLDNFFKALSEDDWRWVKHLRVDLFVGWGTNGQDDWFLSESQRWAKRYVTGALNKYEEGRHVVVQPAQEVKEDSSSRRSLAVDIYLT